MLKSCRENVGDGIKGARPAFFAFSRRVGYKSCGDGIFCLSSQKQVFPFANDPLADFCNHS